MTSLPLINWNPDPNAISPFHSFPIEVQEMINEKESIWKDFIEKVEIRRNSYLMPEVLHHYTNVIGLKGIAFDGEIWLSDFRSTNDPTEGIYAKSLIKELFEKKFSFLVEETQIPDDDELFHESVFNRVFIGCFTENPDQLSQWVHYGAHGTGYCIGIDTNSLISQQWKIHNISYALKLFSVVYDKEQQQKEIEELLDILFDFYVKHKSILEVNSHALNMLEVLIKAICTEVTSLLALEYKNEYFKDEREWRCVLTPPSIPYNTPVKIKDNSLVSYIPINIIVRTIKSGPKADNKSLQFAWGARSMNSGQKMVEFSHSNIPYR